MANFEDVGYEESWRVTFSFNEYDYNLIKNMANEYGKSIKDYISYLINNDILINSSDDDDIADSQQFVSAESVKNTIEKMAEDKDDLTEEEVAVAKVIFHLARCVEK